MDDATNTMRCHSCHGAVETPVTESEGPTNRLAIQAYMHCGLCLKENAGPQELEVGWTREGLQVWCRRHNVNIVHVDFEGQRHRANTTRYVPQGTS